MKIVFCPYLSAMWASMAPLYAEHIAAGDDVTVMPLPYTTRDRDGKPTGYMISRGFNVPTVEADYDALKEMHPNIIYFHNPYDDRNTITQVMPTFFSRRLAECTNELVYAPYYTMGGDIRTAIDSPGVHRANRIIVWSAEQKKNYATTLGASANITVKQRPKPRRDYPMPDDWAFIARGRKLVMLNTSLSAIMNMREIELAKICRVIHDNQNDRICLVWRPHPLYDATLTALLPHLSKSYHDIVGQFITYQQGIFDVSPDLERAVALCAEYIGDPSSVVAFFREQGKPVQII